VCLTPTAAAGTRSTTFLPSADAYVSSTSPNANFGSATSLWVSNESDTRNSHLRFDVAGLAAPVTKATLRVWAQASRNDGFTVHRVTSTTWGESTITYANAPSIPNQNVGKSGATGVSYVDTPLTGVITGDGTYSFALKRSGSKATLAYDSREGAHPPQLVVETTDSIAPAVTLTSPPADAGLRDSTPTLSGAAGTARGDLPGVTVRIYAGSSVAGSPVQTLTTNADGSTWSATASQLADGTFTAQAQQSDDHGNVGTSLPRTFTIDTVAPQVSLTTPAPGAQLTTATPTLAGAAGNAPGDSLQLTVDVYAGSSAQGTPVQTRSVTRQGASWSAVGSSLPDGVYTVRARQSDAAGNEGSSAAVTFSIDAAAPAVTVDAPPPGALLADADPLLTGRGGVAAGDLLTVTVELYAGPQALGLPDRVLSVPVGAGGTWSTRAGALADGAWTVRAVQDDSAGNHGVSAAVTFSVDTGAPAVTVTQPADGSMVSTATPVLSGTAGDATGDGSSVEVSVYVGGTATGTPAQRMSAARVGTTWSVQVGTLADGAYTVQAVQTDAAGNTGRSASSRFMVDTSAPSVAVTEPPAGAVVATRTPSIAGNAGDAPGDAVGVAVELYAGTSATGTPAQTLTTTRSGAAWSVTPAPLADGTYTIRARQSDAAGNVGTSAARTFALQADAPQVTLDQPVEGSVLATRTPTVSGTASDRQGDAGTVSVRIFSGAEASGVPVQSLSAARSGSSWSVTAAALAEGTYTAQAEQSSAGGAIGRSAAVTFTVDTHVAAVTIDQPLPGAHVADATPTMSGTAGTGITASTIVTVRLWAGTTTGGNALQTLTTTRSGAQWSVTAATVDDGTYTAQATQATQATTAGATVSSPPVTFAVDTTAPALTLTAPAAGSATNDPTPRLAGSAGTAPGDETAVTVEVYTGNSATGAPAQSVSTGVSGGGWQTSPAPLADGVYTARAVQRDRAGNVASTVPVTFTVDTAAPALTLTQPAPGELLTGGSVALAGGAGTAPGDAGTVTVRVYAGVDASGAPVATRTATRSGGTWSTTVTGLGDGTYTAQAEQADAAGNAGRSAPVTFRLDGAPPAVSLTAPEDGGALADPTPTIAGRGGTAPDDDTFVTVRLWSGGSAAGPPLQTLVAPVDAGGGFAVEPAALTDGVYTVAAEQLDVSGNTGRSPARSFTVDTAAPAVGLDVPPDGGTVTERAPQLSGPAGSAAGDAAIIEVEIYDGPGTVGVPMRTFSAPVSAGRWSVTSIPLADGQYAVRATQRDAADNVGSASGIFTVRVAAPVVTLDVPADGSFLGTGTPLIAGTGGTGSSDGSQVRVRIYAGASAIGTPLQTLSTTRVGSTWSVRPAALTAGTYTARAEQDGDGGTGFSAPASFTVDTAPPVVSITAPASGSTQSSATPVYRGIAGTEPGDGGMITVRVWSGSGTGGTPAQTLTATRTGDAWSAQGSAPLADGSYTVRAEQPDAAGNLGTSAPVTFSVSTTSYRDEVMTDAPRAYWRLGESSGTVAASETGTNAAGYLRGVGLGAAGAIAGDPNTAAVFNGTNHTVSAPSSTSLGPSDQLTVEAWVMPAVMPSSSATLIRKDGQYLLRYAPDGAVVFRLWKSATTYKEVTTTGGLMRAGAWNQVAASWNGTSITVYVNGAPRATASTAAPSAVTSNPLWIGSSLGTYDFVAGRIDEVAVYGRGLSNERLRLHWDKSGAPDVNAPGISVTSPGPGGVTADSRPLFRGDAGTEPGDSAQVTVRLYAGAAATGTPIQVLGAAAVHDGWAVRASTSLADGTYTVRAEQADAAGNLGVGAPVSFRVARSAYYDAVIADAPTAYWRLGEMAGTAAQDEVGADTGVFLKGVTLGSPGAVAGDPNTAAAFNGTSQSVAVPASSRLTPPDDLTLETWVMPNAMPAGYAALMRRDRQYIVRLTPAGGITVRLYRNGAIREVSTATGLVRQGYWNQVAVTWDGDTVRIYVNGSLRATQSLGGPLDSTNEALYLGSSAGMYDFMAGRLDETAIYDEALPASRIEAHWDESGAPLPPPVVNLMSPAAGSTMDARPTFGGRAEPGRSADVTVRIFAGSSTTGTAVQTLTAALRPAGTYSVTATSALAGGTYTAQTEQSGGGSAGSSNASTFTVDASAPPSILAAGDIAGCDTTGDEATAALLDRLPGIVVPLGDSVYEFGTRSDFENCYDPTWGRHKARSRPAVGDHDYLTDGGAPFFEYFGAAAGDPSEAYYSYDVGNWHVVTLNKVCNVVGGCEAGSPQEQWLRADLAENGKRCTLAFLHSPRFSSGSMHGGSEVYKDLWQALYDGGVEAVISGDDHLYERFAPQTPNGALDRTRGIRQFVAGTGGRSHYTFGTVQPNSEVRNNDTFGVLMLTLQSDRYTWTFVPEAGKAFTDSGSDVCH
jgi:hypothetical protein